MSLTKCRLFTVVVVPLLSKTTPGSKTDVTIRCDLKSLLVKKVFVLLTSPSRDSYAKCQKMPVIIIILILILVN